ncbi:MAG TPA: hypothetical protein VNH18_02795 [Bryobacteraceae bacterium]|nr:hypothetical protein [Bryobacteraceae bacterium]
MADAGTQGEGETRADAAPFPEDELRRYIEAGASTIRATEIEEFTLVADALEKILAELPETAEDLEALEQRLSTLEQKLIALARSRQTDDQGLAARRELDSYLRPYRGKMTAPQLAMLETQFMDRAVLEAFHLSRLSLFHLK